MKAIGRMNQFEIAALVQTQLENNGIKVVLSGGAVVAYYSKNIYVSKDLDLVNVHFAKRRDIKKTMEEIGFFEIDRFFKHPESEFYVEFPPGPLSIGSSPVIEIREVEFPMGRLRLLTPSDCIKDRLAAFFHWNDLQSLEQALLVAQHQKINLSEIEEWSNKEGMLEKYQVFVSRIKM